VRKVFAELWGTERLVVSFDGAGMFRPYGLNRKWKPTKKNWYHLDQAHQKRGLHCIQGLVTLKDATEETGSLVVVPRSHRFHNDILSRYKGDKSNFLSVKVNDRVLTEGDIGPRMVKARAGDLVLWDSRTVHCNTVPLVERNRALLEGKDLIRSVMYVCYTPAVWCSEETFEKRIAGVELGETCTHWPHEYHAKNTPSFRQRRKPQLSDEQLRLVRPDVGDERWRDEESKKALRPGMISFLPPVRYKAARDQIFLRKCPTLEWGDPAGNLKRGETVEGYRFGEWLRVTSRPVNKDEELWAFLGAEDTSAFEPCP